MEIGYGIAPEQRSQGFASEAAQAMVDWALTQDACTVVFAWTNKDNAPSQRVLEKIGMIRQKEQDNQWRWQTKTESAR